MESRSTYRENVLNGVLVVTSLAILGGLILPKMMIESYIIIFGILLILAGVPHGASDFFLFEKLSKTAKEKIKPIHFLLFYLALILVYLFMWWVMPFLAFLIFLAVSAYHFGQSNWANVNFSSKLQEGATAILWGTAILGIPVLLHFDQAQVIILEMTQVSLNLTDSVRTGIVYLLIFGNLVHIVNLKHSGVIEVGQMRFELRNLICLIVLFLTTPLLIGFGIYFVFWHSTVSVLDQIRVLKSIDEKFEFKHYLKSIIPITLLAFIGLALLYYFSGGYFNQGQNLGALFLFVALITVPHSILMEWLYQIGRPILSDGSISFKK